MQFPAKLPVKMSTNKRKYHLRALRSEKNSNSILNGTKQNTATTKNKQQQQPTQQKHSTMAFTGQSLRSPRPSSMGSQADSHAAIIIRRSKRHKAATDNVVSSVGPSICNTGGGAQAEQLEDDTVHTLLTSVFSTLAPGFWWKVLPSEIDSSSTADNGSSSSSSYDISLGTGQDWSTRLLPLLVAGKVLAAPHQKLPIV
jgi:hypothetical protein